MDIRQLNAFAKVYERRSFTRAAEDLFVSQPTVSAHICALEQELGVCFFDRLGRTVLPTKAAKLLYAHCQSIFSSLHQAKSEIALLTQTVSGEMILGGSTIPANYIYPGLVAAFMSRYPDVSVSIVQGNTSDILRRIHQGELSLGIVGARDESSDIVYTSLCDDALSVVASPALLKRHPGLSSYPDIAGLPWIMRQPGSGTRKALVKALEKCGGSINDLRVVCTVDSTESLVRFLRSGQGISVTSLLAAGDCILRRELVALRIPELRLERSFYLACHAHRYQFPAVRKFIEFLSSADVPALCRITHA
jgi:DNA-binding transcriptional LysR family regulator